MSFKKNYIIPLLLLIIAGSFNAALAITAQSGSYQVQLSTDPAVISVGNAQLIITLQSDGKPVSNAIIKTMTQMPGMPMGEREAIARPRDGEPGTYVAPAAFSMAGNYEITLDIAGSAGETTLQIPVKTGQNTAQSARISWLQIIIIALLFTGLAFVIHRIKITQQRFVVKEFFRPATLIAIAVPLILLFAAIYAVRHWRRPGSMTPVQAMGMSMEMPAPTGVLPVQLATVDRGEVDDRVVYSGQAVGYAEQNIYPRVTGVIEWMPLYAGDKIKKGQLLARLETSEYDPQVAAQRAAAAAARQQIGVAKSDNTTAKAQAGEAQSQIGAQSNRVAQAQHQAQKADAAITEKEHAFKAAQSQIDEARSGLQEAQNNYQAQLAAQRQAQNEVTMARQTQKAAQAQVAATKTTIAAAQAAVDSAQADADYWKVELPRMKVLLQGNAVSQQAYDAEVVQSKRASAKLLDAKAQVKQAQATLSVAQADSRAAQAKIKIAQAAASAAASQSAASKSRIETAKATIRQSQALREAVNAEINQAQNAARAARSDVDTELSKLRAQRQATNAAQSNVDAAKKRIGVAQSVARQAQAQLSSAEIKRGYTLIRSQVDGVVTKRLISPGVLVQPGDAILQVAQIDPMRLQANVPEEDLARIHIGNSVAVSLADDSKSTFTAKITSISPAVDAASRTGIVEAILDNPNRQFLPGQYIKMAISVGKPQQSLRVPSSAIQWQADSGDNIETTSATPFVWIAKPIHGEENTFSAQQAMVKIGASDEKTTAILSGVKPGWKVVTGNQINLSDGMSLTDASAPSAKSSIHENDAHHTDMHEMGM